MNLQKKLEQEFYQHFLSSKVPLLSPKHLSALTKQEYYTVQEIFNARYDQMYVENISNKEVFVKTIETLDNIIAACGKTKVNSKNKGVILESEIYIKHYLNLLFTKKEKEIMKGMLDANFHHQQQIQQIQYGEFDESDSSLQVLTYILKGIFGINRSQNYAGNENNEMEDLGYKQSFEFYD